MALQSWGHSHYWHVSSTGGGGAPPDAETWSYPRWQTIHTAGSLFGAVQPWWDWGTELWGFWKAYRRCSPDQLHALTHAAAVVTTPVYATAQQSVRQTAVKPTMRDHHYWQEVGRVAKAWNWSENVYRRLDANETADTLLRAQGSTVTHMDRELAVELAYHALKDRGR